MIIDRTPQNMNEVEKILKGLPDSSKKEEMELFLKKFLKTKSDQVKKIKENLEKLDLLKIKQEHIVKIIDFLPSDASDLNKIFFDVSLNEDETNKILEIVKNSSK
jgi:DNA-directed RNA polymerase subunit F